MDDTAKNNIRPAVYFIIILLLLLIPLSVLTLKKIFFDKPHVQNLDVEAEPETDLQVGSRQSLATTKPVVEEDQPSPATHNAFTLRANDTEETQKLIKETAETDGLRGYVNRPGYYADDSVIVDCGRRIILRCPHYLIKNSTTPMFYPEGSNLFLYGKCRDVDIDTRSFCGF